MADRRVTAYYAQHQLDRYLGADKLDQFAIRRFAKGEPICEIARPVDALHFLVEGRAKVVLPTANGRQLLLCFYEPLQLLGDLELFEPAPLATTTVEAVTPCVCLAVPQRILLDQLADEPRLAQQLCRSLSRKLQRVISNSALNLLHPLEHRVASYILATATTDHEERLVFSGNLTAIADQLGTSFRHLHRTLRSLCHQGILVKTKAVYRIQQAEELQRRAAGIYLLS